MSDDTTTTPTTTYRPLGVCRIVVHNDGSTSTEILAPGDLPPVACYTVHDPPADVALPVTGLHHVAGAILIAAIFVALGLMLKRAGRTTKDKSCPEN